jgi:hypothetical protein
MRTLREAASDLREIVPTAVPEFLRPPGAVKMTETLKKTQDPEKATTGIEA